jgi:hypothetical protein
MHQSIRWEGRRQNNFYVEVEVMLALWHLNRCGQKRKRLMRTKKQGMVTGLTNVGNWKREASVRASEGCKGAWWHELEENARRRKNHDIRPKWNVCAAATLLWEPSYWD